MNCGLRKVDFESTTNSQRLKGYEDGANCSAASKPSCLCAFVVRNPQSAIGVTLIELLIVVAIIGIVGAVVVPGVTSGLDTVRLRTTAERLGNTFRFARESALHRQVVCQVTVDPARQTVSLEEIDVRHPAASRLRSWEIPVGVTVNVPEARAFIFGPDGGGPEVKLVLRNSRGRKALVEVDALTGLPQVTMQ